MWQSWCNRNHSVIQLGALHTDLLTVYGTNRDVLYNNQYNDDNVVHRCSQWVSTVCNFDRVQLTSMDLHAGHHHLRSFPTSIPNCLHHHWNHHHLSKPKQMIFGDVSVQYFFICCCSKYEEQSKTDTSTWGFTWYPTLYVSQSYTAPLMLKTFLWYNT